MQKFLLAVQQILGLVLVRSLRNFVSLDLRTVRLLLLLRTIDFLDWLLINLLLAQRMGVCCGVAHDGHLASVFVVGLRVLGLFSVP